MGVMGLCGLGGVYEKSKPTLAMIFVQFGFAGMNIISKVALNKGMSHFAFVFYRHVVATMVTAPLAYMLERNLRSKLTSGIFCQMFISAFLGNTVNQNFYYAGLSYTSTSFACAMSNIVPAVTFLMAVSLRMERVAIRSLSGQAKVIGTIVSVGGAMIMIFYKGIPIQIWRSPFHMSDSASNANTFQSKDWTKGSLFLVSSSISWSSWFILQAKIGKTYPAPYTTTALMCFLTTIQTGLLSLIFEMKNPNVWAIGWDIRLLTAVYSGIVASGIAYFVMLWCIRRRGPLFVTLFGPLLLIIVAIMGSIILNEKLHLGSVIGSILIISGLYAVIWAKGKEMEKVIELPRKDLEEIVSVHDLSNHSLSEVSNSNSKDLSRNSNLAAEATSAFGVEQSTQNAEKFGEPIMAPDPSNNRSPNHNDMTIDCSGFYMESSDDTTVSNNATQDEKH